MVGLSGHTPPSRGGRVNFFFLLVVDTRYPEGFVIVTLSVLPFLPLRV